MEVLGGFRWLMKVFEAFDNFWVVWTVSRGFGCFRGVSVVWEVWVVLGGFLAILVNIGWFLGSLNSFGGLSGFWMGFGWILGGFWMDFG